MDSGICFVALFCGFASWRLAKSKGPGNGTRRQTTSKSGEEAKAANAGTGAAQAAKRQKTATNRPCGRQPRRRNGSQGKGKADGRQRKERRNTYSPMLECDEADPVVSLDQQPTKD